MRLVSGNGSTAARLAALRLLQRLGGSSPSATALMVVEPVQLADALVLLVLEAGAAPAAVQPKGKAAAADAAKSVSLPRVHCRVHTLSTVPPHERHARHMHCAWPVSSTVTAMFWADLCQTLVHAN